MNFLKSKQFFKSLIICVLAGLIVLSLVFSAISVSAESSIAISTVDDLKKMVDKPEATYHLTNDIVFTESDGEFAPLFSATNQFKGTFDGKGHSIIGVNVSSAKSSTGSSSYSGIFAYNAGTIKNLNVENSSATVEKSKYAYTGILVAVNLGTIDNCYVSGESRNKNIEITAYTGGICGQMLKGEITNSVSYANIYSSGGEQYTGGIAGYTEKGIINKTASFGSIFVNGIDTTMDGYAGGVTGFSRAGSEFSDCLFGGGIIVEKTSNAYIGGVSGITFGSVKSSVSYGTLTPSEVISHIYIGGAVGEESNATVKYAYHLKGTINEEITGKSSKELTDAELIDRNSYDGFDFSSVWSISDGKISLVGLPSPSNKDVISQLSGIKINKKPTKLEYVQGDPALDLTGLMVSAVYSNGDTIALKQNEYTVGGYNYVITGKQTITVSYKGFTDTFDINVKKTSAGVIAPSGVTDGSYQDGNSNGVVSNKKPGSADKETSSKKPAGSVSSNTGGNLGPNAVIDTLEDNDTTVSEGTESKNASNDSKDDTASTESSGSNRKTTFGGKLHSAVTSPAGIIVIIIVLLAIIGFAVVWFILKNKSKSVENEVSNDELKEVNFDENDVYNK